MFFPTKVFRDYADHIDIGVETVGPETIAAEYLKSILAR